MIIVGAVIRAGSRIGRCAFSVDCILVHAARGWRIRDYNPIPNAEIMADRMARYNGTLVLASSGETHLAKNRRSDSVGGGWCNRLQQLSRSPARQAVSEQTG